MKHKIALELVADLFRDVNREVTGLPYITHLVGVSYIASTITKDEDVIIAALLHDVLEDIPGDIYSELDMRKQFGDWITDIVKTVSHEDDKYGKEESRSRYLQQISSGPVEACMVSASDLLHNSTDIVYVYKNDPDAIRNRFGGERAKFRSWFWSERYKILESRLGEDNKVILQLKSKLQELEKVHSEII